MRKRKPERPICGCEHDLAYHEPDGDGGGSVCHATVYQNTYKDGRNTTSFVPCTCQQYTGPRIIDPGYIARALPVDPRLKS